MSNHSEPVWKRKSLVLFVPAIVGACVQVTFAEVGLDPIVLNDSIDARVPIKRLILKVRTGRGGWARVDEIVEVGVGVNVRRTIEGMDVPRGALVVNDGITTDMSRGRPIEETHLDHLSVCDGGRHGQERKSQSGKLHLVH
jgi:hypothetical protein